MANSRLQLLIFNGDRNPERAVTNHRNHKNKTAAWVEYITQPSDIAFL